MYELLHVPVRHRQGSAFTSDQSGYAGNPEVPGLLAVGYKRSKLIKQSLMTFCCYQALGLAVQLLWTTKDNELDMEPEKYLDNCDNIFEHLVMLCEIPQQLENLGRTW